MAVSVADFLKHCSDWSAPFEVASRIYGQSFTPNQLRRTKRGLIAMRLLGMADHHKGNDTYRCRPTTLTIEEKDNGTASK